MNIWPGSPQNGSFHRGRPLSPEAMEVSGKEVLELPKGVDPTHMHMAEHDRELGRKTEHENRKVAAKDEKEVQANWREMNQSGDAGSGSGGGGNSYYRMSPQEDEDSLILSHDKNEPLVLDLRDKKFASRFPKIPPQFR